MRPLRFLLSLASCIVVFLLLVYIGPWQFDKDYAEDDFQESTGMATFLNWRTPSSLFPPSALISLTDDNSTSFPARPAAFGPLLPVKSLSGQLWIGSGFGGDGLGRGRASDAEGELGCSDIPDWSDGGYWTTPAPAIRKPTSDARGAMVGAETPGKRKRSMPAEADEAHEEEESQHPHEEDGTDDHLHHPLTASDGLKTNGEPAGNTRKPAHADIQSLQEGAEIAGKIVLLSRGGCGFLEKVKWAQRRGGVALIVGDDIRGGPLVTMYARGDTSNVTIPALFTSHTTAHLLTTLIPPGGELEELFEEELALALAMGEKVKDAKVEPGQDNVLDKPNFTTTSLAPTAKATSISKKSQKTGASPKHTPTHDTASRERIGWLRRLFGSTSADRHKESSRPPSSGSLDWVPQKEHDDTGDAVHHSIGKPPGSRTKHGKGKTGRPDSNPGDGFVIGIQDWRDPDLVVKIPTESVSSSAPTHHQTNVVASHGLKGGSITPGSGEYLRQGHGAVDLVKPGKAVADDPDSKHDAESDASSYGWFDHLLHVEHEDSTPKPPTKHADAKTPALGSRPPRPNSNGNTPAAPPAHDGLWVTLSPTSMSSSPFFDTLLVLVVSPLVTLTVVYALLLLRSRIRRRRWRAPKSVVERLPVRTYQTLSSASSTTSTLSNVSATTPLLPSSARTIEARTRPRSRTASEVPVPSRSSVPSMASPSLEQVEESRAAGLAEWRRRYGGKQRECVVCLEDYVDGVSRVMSLPCGHEFHAECM